MPHESLQNVAEKWCDLTWPTVAEAEAGPIRSRELGRQLAVRLLTTSHPPPTTRQHAHTLRLIAKRGQRDFKPPQASPHPPRIGPTKYIQKKTKNQEKNSWDAYFDCWFRPLYVATFSFVFLLLFISLARLGVSLSLRLSVCLSRFLATTTALLRFCCQAILQRLLSKLRNVTAYA